MPIDLANAALKPACYNSVRVNPFPALSLVLYFNVQARTTGFNVDVGLGNIAWAFALRDSSLLFLRPAWLNQVLTPILYQCFLK